MKQLLLGIDGLEERDAWYITKKYPTFKSLWNA